jgi:prepilin-type N-terminal cleavage/methylation domain-containing protein
MNFLPTSRSAKDPGGKFGFTLVEMITAIAVLSLMMVMMGQILAMASHAWLDGERNVNNFTKARAMLDMFASDVESGVFRTDLAAFQGTSIEFYTQRQGVAPSAGAVRSVSLVQYAYKTDQSTPVNMSTLQRGDMSIFWTASANSITFGDTTDFESNTPTFRDMVPGVIDYKPLFVYSDGTLSPTYTVITTNPLHAVGLTLAVVDDRTLGQLTTTQIQALRTAFDGAATGTRSVKADWEDYERTSLTWSAYPKSLGAGLKVFEIYVNLTGL